MTFRSRRAFTLVELVVTISIIAILLSISLPAIQLAREAGRQTICKNNLKQIGLAMHNYHGVHNHLPLGVQAAGPGSKHTGYSWHFAILPFLEQLSLYEKFDQNRHTGSPANIDLLATSVPVFLCPSDAARSHVEVPLGEEKVKTARGNYVGVSPVFQSLQSMRQFPASHELIVGEANAKVDDELCFWVAPTIGELASASSGYSHVLVPMMPLKFENSEDCGFQFSSHHGEAIQALRADGGVEILNSQSRQGEGP